MAPTFPRGGVGVFWSFIGLWILVIVWGYWLQVVIANGQEKS